VTYKTKLIEVSLPLEAINRESAREKSIRHGHPSTLHLWWARRPLAACRAVLFASLVDDPSAHPDEFPTEEAQEKERERLFAIIEELVKWENTTNEHVLNAAREEILRSTDGNPPPVLDPFCGGGSIPLEAQRLGLEAHASDLNPVAVLITKALIEIPPKFANMPPVNPESREKLDKGRSYKGAEGLAEDIRYYGRWMRDEAEKRIGHLYPKAKLPDGTEATVIAWLWARTVKCPNPACGAEMPLSRIGYLGKENRGDRSLSFEWSNGSIRSRVVKGRTAGTVARRGVTCSRCGDVHGLAQIRPIVRSAGFGSRLIGIVARGSSGQVFVDASPDQEEIALTVKKHAEPALELVQASQYMGPTNWGVRTVAELSSSRQTVALETLSRLLHEALANVEKEGGDHEYASAVVTYLACAIGRSVDMWTLSAVWAGSFIAHTFGWPALPFSWDSAEANPLGEATGSWKGAIDWVARAVALLPASGIARVDQMDAIAAARRTESSMLVTDPPYYNNVPYADLSDVFFAWHRRGVAALYPDLFRTLATPKSEELVATPYHFNGSIALAEQHFENGMRQFFDQIASISGDWPACLFYAFKQQESTGDGADSSTGWETMLTGLIAGGLSVRATWPVRTERSGRLRETGSNALASSIVLVCRPRPDDAPTATRREFITALKAELPDALRHLQKGNIAPVDLAQASIGPGMAVFSRYKEVQEVSGEPMRVRTALELINQMLAEVLTEQESGLDPSTRFAVSWFEQHGMDEGAFGQADVLARAYDVAVDALDRDGILTARRGKVRLVPWTDLTPGWDPRADVRPTVWEATHHLIKAHQDPEGGSEQAAAELLRVLGEEAGEHARDLSYRLYVTCERKGWADEALAYNALVVAWPELKRLAAGAGTGQMTL
jgi:putative DNA methylase